MQNEEFWLELEVSPRELDGLSDLQAIFCIRELVTHQPGFEVLAAKFFGKESIDVNDSSQMKELGNLVKSKHLYGLRQFAKGKLDLLREYFEKSGQISQQPFFTLVELYMVGSFEKIIDASYYCQYKKLHLSESWRVDPVLNETTLKTIETEIGKLQRRINTRVKRRTQIARQFKAGNKTILFFEREKKECVVSGYNERKPLRKKGVFAVTIDLPQSNVRLYTKDPRLNEVFANFFISELKSKVYVEQATSEKNDLADTFKSILSYEGNKIELTGVTFNRLGKGIDCITGLKRTKGMKPLRENLETLSNEGILDSTDLMLIKNITVDAAGIERTVRVNREEGQVIFSIERSGLADEKYDEIVDLLKSELNIAVDAPYPYDDGKLDKKIVLKNIIRKHIHNLSPCEKQIYSEVLATGIFHTLTERSQVCIANNSHFFANSNFAKCPKCGDALRDCPSREVISINGTALSKYVANKLQNIFGKESIVKTKQYLKVILPQGHVYVYPYMGGRITSLLQKWSAELAASLRIIVDKEFRHPHNTSLDNEIYLYDFIFDTDDQLKSDVLNKALHKYVQVLQKQSNDAHTRLTDLLSDKIALTGNEFEQVCFPLLRSIFPGLQHWGVLYPGKSLPDDFFGIRMSKHKTDAFTMIVDCKHPERREEYDLNDNEKRKAKSYIRRTQQFSEIKDFSGKLSAYLIISDGIGNEKFSKFAENIRLFRKWKGKMILMPLQILTDFYARVKQIQNDDLLKLAIAMAFATHIKKSQLETIILAKSDIDTIFTAANTLKGSLDLSKVAEYIAKGEEF